MPPVFASNAGQTAYTGSPETILASSLNNEALQLEMAGNFVGAEAKHLEALRLKIQGNGADSPAVALTRNALGELYLKMGKIDEGLQMLEEAERVRSNFADDFDAACTRDNLGRAWEMKGDIEKAIEWRTKGALNGKMICSHFNCPKSSTNKFSKRADLSACAKCKCAFYCNRDCQKRDWKERHKTYCKSPAAA